MQTLEQDIIAIRSLADRYSDAASRREPKEMAAVYALDGELIAFGNAIKGRDALETAFEHTCNTFALINQICSGAVISVEGNKATSRWTVTEFVRRPDGDKLELFMGNYEDELERMDEAWLYKRRILTRRAQARFAAEFR